MKKHLQIWLGGAWIPLRGQCVKDPHKNNIKHHHTCKQTMFTLPAPLQTQPLQTNLRKPPVSLTLIILPGPLLITTLTPITQFLPTPTLGHQALPTQTQSNPYHHQDMHNLSRQHTTVQSPSHPPQYYCQNHQPIAKIESNTHDHFSFLYEKIINLQHQLDNTAGENGSVKRRKHVYWGKTRVNQ